MKVAIAHYHLARSGVTQVIASHVEALEAAGGGLDELAILHGGPRDGWPSVPAGGREIEPRLVEVPGLGYDDSQSPRPGELARRLRESLAAIGFRPQETVVHVHNHALGKNLSLPGALASLARDGYALLLHTHDFAEDFRPGNYRRLAAALAPESAAHLPRLLYPVADHVHHAVLNRRDEAILRRAGVPAEGLHLLPNPVAGTGTEAPRGRARRRLERRFGVPAEARFVLYPVRGIRRKNLGEALLWSVLAGDATWLGLTLPPTSPQEQPSYAAWKELASALDLRCRFEIGDAGGLELEDSLAAADLVLTTSVAEGFGLVFLEPWLAGRALAGRDLPEISADFKASGLVLSGLEPRLEVPIDWVGSDSFCRTTARAFGRTLEAYGRTVPRSEVLEREIRALVRDGNVDFAALDVVLQARVIDQVSRQPRRRRALLVLNPWIRPALAGAGDSAEMRRNAGVVRRRYSLEATGRRLLAIYRDLLGRPRAGDVEPAAHAERILDELLSLRRFHPLRV